MIIVDASVLANAFTDDGLAGAAARAELANDPKVIELYLGTLARA